MFSLRFLPIRTTLSQVIYKPTANEIQTWQTTVELRLAESKFKMQHGFTKP